VRDARRTISLLTVAFRMNITSLNQADHCILAYPNQVPVNQLPTLKPANQVLDFSVCSQLFERRRRASGSSSRRCAAASANDLGGRCRPTFTRTSR
jgi:hypothetical protein